MALQVTNVEIPIATGINSKTDPKHLTGNLVTAQNAVFAKNGAVRKRNGFTALSRNVVNGATMTSGAKLLGYQNQLLMIDGKSLYSYSPAQAQWTKQSPVPEVTATRQTVWAGTTIATGTDAILNPDVCYANGLLYLTWLDRMGDLVYAVQDATTGAQVKAPTYAGVTGVTTYRLVGVAGAVGVCPVIFVASTGGGTAITALSFYNGPISPAGLTPSSYSVTGITLAAATSPFDVIYSAAGRVLIGYQGAQLRVGSFTTSQGAGFTLVQSNSIASGTLFTAVGMCDGTGVSYVTACATASSSTYTTTAASVSQTTGAFATSYGTSGAAATGVPNQQPFTSQPVELSLNNLLIVNGMGLGSGQRGAMAVVTAGAFSATGGPPNGPAPVSRPFLRNGVPYVYARINSVPIGFVTTTTSQTSDVLLDISGGYYYQPGFSSSRMVATIAPRLSGNLTSFNTPPVTPTVGHVSAVDANTYVMTSFIVVNASPVQQPGLSVTRLNFADPSRWQSAELNGELFVAGSLPSVYDGNTLFEVGFANQPYLGLSFSGTGGAIAAGTYSYLAIYEHIDARGVTHQSIASNQVQVTTTGSTSSVSVGVNGLQASNRPDVRVIFYRTTAGGSTYYRMDDGTGALTPFSGTGSATVLLVDKLPDNTTQLPGGLAAQPTFTLTVQGGAVPNTNPPAATCVVAHRGSLWLGGTDEGAQLWYSESAIPGVAMNFDDAFTIPLDDAPVTGLASMDDKLIAFTKRHIFETTGDVPTATGTGSTLTTVQIQADSGCLSPLSVVRSPQGTWFQSVQGLYLLDRSLNVTYAGSNVESEVDANPFLSGATLVDTEGQIRWNTAPAANGQAQQVIYDYVQNAWSTWQMQEPSASPVLSSAQVGGVYYLLAQNGTVYFEDVTTALDAGRYVPLTIVTAWTNPDVLQGFERWRRLMVLADSYEAHQLNVQWAVDYNPAIVSSRTFVQTGAGIEQWEAHIDRQKCEAFQITIYDAAPTTGIVSKGLGFSLSSIMVELGTKRGVNKLPATARS